MTQVDDMGRGDPVTKKRRRFGNPPDGGVSALDSAPFGWAPLWILVAIGIVDAMESRIVAGALPVIQQEFGIGDAMAGAIPTAVTIAGAIVTLPAGWLADRYNRSNLIALVVFSWAFLLLGTALAPTFALFFATRVVIGAADSIDNPSSGSLLGDLYPPLTRAKAFGWARLTTYAGGALGVAYAGVVTGLLGWRWAYALMIFPGLICAWLVWQLREPVRGFMDRVAAVGGDKRLPAPPSPDDEPASALGKMGEVVRGGARRLPFSQADEAPDDEAMAAHEKLKQQLDFKAQLRYVFEVPTLRLVTFGLMALAFGLGGVVFWVPSLMVRDFGVSVEVAGPVAGLVSLLGMVGGTWYGGRLGRKWHGTRKGGRLLAGGSGLLVGSLMLAIAIAQPTLLRFAVVLALATGLMALAIPNLMASVADVLLATSRGLGFSLLQFLVAAAGAFSPTIAGAISDATGSLVAGMYALVVPGALSGVLVLMARRYFDHDAGLVLDAAREEGAAEAEGHGDENHEEEE